VKVLVIGGTRFVGRAIVEGLLQRGHEVIIYHRGQHERVLNVCGIAELVAQVMGHEWEMVSVPNDRLPAANPYATPYHIVYDLSRIRADLGYRGSVSLEQGMRRTVEWLVANPPGSQTWGVARYLKEDAFDYAAEDAAITVAAKLRRGDVL
jgi:nucleoside-diphosphate-sugar epimerase